MPLNYNQKILLFLSCIRMSGKNINWQQKNQESNFYKNEKVKKIDDIHVNKVFVFKEDPYGTKNSFKYFIGYKDNDAIMPLCIKLPQTTGYVKKIWG